MFKDRTPILIEEHYVLDTAGTWSVEKEYAQTGCKEGWLVYIHGMRDYRGVICHTYRHISRE